MASTLSDVTGIRNIAARALEELSGSKIQWVLIDVCLETGFGNKMPQMIKRSKKENKKKKDDFADFSQFVFVLFLQFEISFFQIICFFPFYVYKIEIIQNWKKLVTLCKDHTQSNSFV